MAESKSNTKLDDLSKSHAQIQKIISAALSRDENVQPVLKYYSEQRDTSTSETELSTVITAVQEIVTDYRKGAQELESFLRKLPATHSNGMNELRTKAQRQLTSVNDRIRDLQARLEILKSRSSAASLSRRRTQTDSATKQNESAATSRPASTQSSGGSYNWMNPFSRLNLHTADTATQSSQAGATSAAKKTTSDARSNAATSSKPVDNKTDVRSRQVARQPQPSSQANRNTTGNASKPTSSASGSAKPPHSEAGSSKPNADGNIDEQYLRSIRNEIVQPDNKLQLADVVGSDEAKKALVEAVIMPLKRPDLFNGLRMPARGILLFGPPGNGKTLLARAIANEAGATLLNVSAATLVSKWVGDGEKLARALFTVARERQPAIVFIDEIDSLLRERTESDAESSRRLKTQLLIELDGAVAKSSDDKQPDLVMVLAATNRPAELDTAALRRFPRRIYMRMPDLQARESLLHSLLEHNQHRHALKAAQIAKLAQLTDGYSNSDLTALARDAAMAPIRSLSANELMQVRADELRPITLQDFNDSLKTVRRSVPPEQIQAFDEWNKNYGTTT